jgi:hypothetical protein
MPQGGLFRCRNSPTDLIVSQNAPAEVQGRVRSTVTRSVRRASGLLETGFGGDHGDQSLLSYIAHSRTSKLIVYGMIKNSMEWSQKGRAEPNRASVRECGGEQSGVAIRAAGEYDASCRSALSGTLDGSKSQPLFDRLCLTACVVEF